MTKTEVAFVASAMTIVILALTFAASGQQVVFRDVWKVTMVAPVESVGGPDGDSNRYYLLSTGQRFMILGDVEHSVIRFLEARRGQMVTVTVEGGTPE